MSFLWLLDFSEGFNVGLSIMSIFFVTFAAKKAPIH
jgi:hypothetical protein